MIKTQYCSPAPTRTSRTPHHLRPQGRDVKAAAFHDHRQEGSLSKGQMTVMGVMWRINFPLTRKQIVANCPASNPLLLSSVCGRVNELIEKGLVDCNETTFDKDTRKHVQALVLSEKGKELYSASLREDGESEATSQKKSKGSTKYSKIAAILCGDYDFNCYVYEYEKSLSEKLSRSETSDFDGLSLLKNRPVSAGISKERHIVDDHQSTITAKWIRAYCVVSSRAQLDTDFAASEKLKELIWDFALWVSRRSRPALVLKLIGAQ